jgi:hypothetical protein
VKTPEKSEGAQRCLLDYIFGIGTISKYPSSQLGALSRCGNTSCSNRILSSGSSTSLFLGLYVLTPATSMLFPYIWFHTKLLALE